jgi:carbon monoxide dehydrogenase subunit G
MSNRWLRALCAVLTLCASAQAATPDPDVRVRRDDGTMHVLVQVSVPVDVDTAWRVLTDYDALSAFVPDMDVSRLLKRDGARALVQQEGTISLVVMQLSTKVILEVDESAPTRLHFRAVGGNVRRMEGEWRVKADGASIALTYDADIEPEAWVPPLVGAALLKKHVERQVAGLVREMTRRYGAKSRSHLGPGTHGFA